MKKKYDKRENGLSDDAKAMEVLEKFGYDMPNSKELENRVLGAILMDEAILGDVITGGPVVFEGNDYFFPGLKPEHFFNSKNKIIYKAIVSLYNKRTPIDINLIKEEILKQRLDPQDVFHGTMTEYLINLTEATSTSASVIIHSIYIYEKYVLREITNVGSELANEALRPDVNTWEVLNSAEAKIFAIRNQFDGHTVVRSVKDEARSVIDEMIANKSETGITGVPTGYYHLDKATGGLQKQNLYIIGGRPSNGKSAFATNIAWNATIEHKKRIGFLSMEMSFRDLFARLIAMDTGLNSKDVLNRHLSNKQWQKVAEVSEIFSKADIWIDDTGGMNILDIKAKARKMKKEFDIDLLFVDYLQLATGLGRWDNKTYDIGEVSAGLKQLAKELDIPVAACAQLSRENVKGKVRKPILPDLRESGNIEQDADVVIFVHRKFMHLSDAEKEAPDIDDKKANGLSIRNEADIIIAKGRNIGLHDLKFGFNDVSTKFFEPVWDRNYNPKTNEKYPEPADVQIPMPGESDDDKPF